jgi:hypothetical protein
LFKREADQTLQFGIVINNQNRFRHNDPSPDSTLRAFSITFAPLRERVFLAKAQRKTKGAEVSLKIFQKNLTLMLI